MSNSPARKFVFLLSVLCIALIAGYVLKIFIAGDIRRSFDDERAARVRLIASDLERSYERYKAWNREDAAETAVRALILGMRVEIKDANNVTVTDTEKALAALSPERKARVLALSPLSDAEQNGAEQIIPLARGQENVGRLSMRFLKSASEGSFMKRWGILLIVWAVLTTVLALVPAFLLLRQPGGAASEGGPGRSIGRTVLEKTEARKPRQRQVVAEENVLLVNAPATEVQEAEPDEPSDEADEAVQPLAGDEDRIKKIIAGLDELARVEALGKSLKKQPINLAQYLTAAVEKARGAVRDKEVTFNIECDRGLVLSIDPHCLSGILENLLENAAQAIKQTGTVTVSAANDGDRIRLSIKDTGRGIKRKDMPHIFERFYRGSGNGIGLGLTIVKALVDASGGTIEVESARGNGCLVRVRMPRNGADAVV